MSKKRNKLKSEALGIAKEVYTDVAKKPLKETGKVFALVPRVIHAALANVEKWVLNKEYSIKETQKALEYKLQNLTPGDLEEPEPYVAVPAINALSYSFGSNDLIDLYANLLASSMIKEDKWKVHPSFVEIIKQLSPDEAKLLKYLSDFSRDKEFPLINLTMDKTNANVGGETYVEITNFSSISFGVCDLPEKISSYIDNLSRLKLIEIFNHNLASNYDYNKETSHPYILKYKESHKLRDGFEWGFMRFLFILSTFGKEFIEICVNNPKLKK